MSSFGLTNNLLLASSCIPAAFKFYMQINALRNPFTTNSPTSKLIERHYAGNAIRFIYLKLKNYSSKLPSLLGPGQSYEDIFRCALFLTPRWKRSQRFPKQLSVLLYLQFSFFFPFTFYSQFQLPPFQLAQFDQYY